VKDFILEKLREVSLAQWLSIIGGLILFVIWGWRKHRLEVKKLQLEIDKLRADLLRDDKRIYQPTPQEIEYWIKELMKGPKHHRIIGMFFISYARIRNFKLIILRLPDRWLGISLPDKLSKTIFVVELPVQKLVPNEAIKDRLLDLLLTSRIAETSTDSMSKNTFEGDINLQLAFLRGWEEEKRRTELVPQELAVDPSVKVYELKGWL
jgi:hypothetical protein